MFCSYASGHDRPTCIILNGLRRFLRVMNAFKNVLYSEQLCQRHVFFNVNHYRRICGLKADRRRESTHPRLICGVSQVSSLAIGTARIYVTVALLW